MTDKLFYDLWVNALGQPDKDIYIKDHGSINGLNQSSIATAEITGILGNIYDVAHMSIRDMILKSGLTQAAFALKFCIPLRTVEDWATSKRKCADYIRLMIAKDLGLLSTLN